MAHNCDYDASCTDTSTKYNCECIAGHNGTGLINGNIPDGCEGKYNITINLHNYQKINLLIY